MTTRVKIADRWSEITVRQFQEYKKQVTPEFAKAKPVQSMIRTVAIMTDMALEDVESMTLKDLELTFAEVVKLLDKRMDTRLKPFIMIEGVEYGFHPQVRKMTAGEWVDLDTFCQADNNGGDIWNTIHKMMAVLYRPVTEKKIGLKMFGKTIGQTRYKIEDYQFDKVKERFDLFRTVDVETANAVSVFFWAIAAKYAELIPSMNNRTKKTKLKK